MSVHDCGAEIGADGPPVSFGILGCGLSLRETVTGTPLSGPFNNEEDPTTLTQIFIVEPLNIKICEYQPGEGRLTLAK